MLGLLIVMFGLLAIFRTPTGVFPNTGIPVAAVGWTCFCVAPVFSAVHRRAHAHAGVVAPLPDASAAG